MSDAVLRTDYCILPCARPIERECGLAPSLSRSLSQSYPGVFALAWRHAGFGEPNSQARGGLSKTSRTPIAVLLTSDLLYSESLQFIPLRTLAMDPLMTPLSLPKEAPKMNGPAPGMLLVWNGART